MTQSEQDETFQRWLSEHGAMLHHVANGFAAEADRQDLFQELLLALWRSAAAFRGHARASTFIYRVAHNAALTWKRSETNYRKRMNGLEEANSTLAASTPAAPPPQGELLDLVYERIRDLPPVDRSLILLHLDDLSYGEIAEIHGLSVSNVGVRLNRLKQKLTTALETISHELR